MVDGNSPRSTPERIDDPLNFGAVLPIFWQRDYLTSKVCNMTEACLHG